MARSKTAQVGTRPTAEQTARFEMLSPMIDAAHEEIGELSKKKPDGLLNALKVRHLNKLLKEVLAVIEGEPTIAFLELLDEEQLPQNSDAVFMLAQYKAAMKHFHDTHWQYNGAEWGWITRP